VYITPIVNSCPYDVIYWNEEKKLPQKCTLCAHRLENGGIPRCVEACPSDAILFGDLDDPNPVWEAHHDVFMKSVFSSKKKIDTATKL
jgi:Fe-S-cluster-containing dehydrogenase component